MSDKLNILRIFFIGLVVQSCTQEMLPCEAFDFKRIPFDTAYYYEPLYYTNNLDTILLSVDSKGFSDTSEWGAYGYDCNPEFYFHKKAINNRSLELSYSFKYYANGGSDTSIYLGLLINSASLEINLDSIKRKINQEIVFDNFLNLGSNSSQFIKKIKFKNLLVTEVEGYSGKIWRLVKIGDSIVN